MKLPKIRFWKADPVINLHVDFAKFQFKLFPNITYFWNIAKLFYSFPPPVCTFLSVVIN